MIIKSIFRIPISLEPDDLELLYFKLWILLGQMVKVRNIKLRHQGANILGLEK